MLKDVVVGYRFSPTGEELINHYLKNKILGKTWLVDEAISEINFLSYIPELLPRLAKIQSDNLEWYFFSRIEYTNPKKKNAMKRSTGCGYWKPTGKDRKIKDKRGNGVEIGLKKTLVYHKGKVPNGDRTPWVIHEYHITCLPQDQYKGEDGDIPFGGTYSSEPSQSMVSDSNSIREAINSAPKFEQPGQENIFGMSMDDLKSPTNEQEDLSLWDVLHPDMLFSDNNNPTLLPHLAPNDDEFLGGLRHIDRDQVEYLFANEEFISTPTSYMQENRSDHRPKKPLSGIILDYSCDTDSDAESISATSYQGTSSPGGDRVGSSNSHSQTGLDEMISLSKDLQTSHEPSISRKTRESQLKQEIKQDTSRASGAFIDKKSYMVKTEKKGWFITEEAMERNRNIPRYVYLVRMIIGFIILLALIGNIISVLTLKSD